MFYGGEKDSNMARWWRNAPSQIACRLLMRLVRAEHREVE
jgi:hypothetical protein